MLAMLDKNSAIPVDRESVRALLEGLKPRSLIKAEEHYRSLRDQHRAENIKRNDLIAKNHSAQTPTQLLKKDLAALDGVISQIDLELRSAREALDKARAAAVPAINNAIAPMMREIAATVLQVAALVELARMPLSEFDRFVAYAGLSEHVGKVYAPHLPNPVGLRHFAERITGQTPRADPGI